MSKRGQFIVFYGINNIGKSTQARALAEQIKKEGGEAVYVKFPIYDIEPSGRLINDALRKGNPHNLTSRELQIIFALNRTQYAALLEEDLAKGINVVAEDYVGTSLAWGIANGVDKNFLIDLNSHLPKEDIIFLLDGEPFGGAETKHVFEGNHELTIKARKIHQELAHEFKWDIIDAHKKVDEIHENVWSKLKV